MTKRFALNLVLVILSSAVAMVGCEFVYRKLIFGENEAFSKLRNPADYSMHIRHENEDFFNEDYWKLNYLFGKKYNIRNPHPLLGWTGSFDLESLLHNDFKKINGRRPVLLYGDSFAQGTDSVMRLENHLNNDSAFASQHYFLNYGVGGYGVDQTFMLFEKTAGMFNRPVVVFSMLTTDLDRSMLSVRDAPKPYFILSDSGLVLQGTPITLSTREYFETNPPRITSYLWNRLVTSFFNEMLYDSLAQVSHMEEIKKLNEAILLRAFAKMKAMNTDFVVVLFHPVHHPGSDWRLAWLRELCRKNQIPFISDRDLRYADTTFASFDPDRFAIAGDGHPTSYAYKLLAAELKLFVLDRAYRENIIAQTGGPLDERSRLIEFYKLEIRSTANWLDDVRKKAAERGIPTDSMILLDAIYMADQAQK